MGVTGVDSPGRTLECLCSGSLRFGDALECAPLLCEEPVTSGDCTLLVGVAEMKLDQAMVSLVFPFVSGLCLVDPPAESYLG